MKLFTYLVVYLSCFKLLTYLFWGPIPWTSGWTKSCTTVHHALLISTKESSFQTLLGGAKWILSIPSMYMYLSFFGGRGPYVEKQ